MRDDGSEVQQLTTQATCGTICDFPDISPDGSAIVFGCQRPIGICVINTDGSGLTPLFVSGDRESFSVSWSPDGAQIAFVSRPIGGDNDVWVMNSDGTSARQITNLGDVGTLDWSPDGQRFLVSRNDSRGLWVVDVEGRDPTRLTDDQGSSARWSPDGSRIAFVLDGQLHVMNAGRIGPFLVPTDGDEVIWAVAWAPDGLRLAYPIRLGPGHVNLGSIKLDGSGKVRLTDGPWVDGSVAWV